MRLHEIENPGLRFPKPYAIIPYDDEEEPAPIWANPSAGTIMKCINHECRALIYADGMLVVWAKINMYHQDVYDALKRGVDFRPLNLFAPGKWDAGVAVKGEPEEPEPFTDEKWLSVLHHNRALDELYGEDFDVVTLNWW
jgi:hypothetical protein